MLRSAERVGEVSREPNSEKFNDECWKVVREIRMKTEVCTCNGIQEATELNIAIKEEWLFIYNKWNKIRTVMQQQRLN